jgi:hypothetical protein
MHRLGGPVVTDDFQSNGQHIVGFHWWGSYFQNDPQLTPPADRTVQFEISFHPDCPAGTPISVQCPGDPDTGLPYPYSTPGQPYQFQIIDAEESFDDITLGGERVYEYWALLDEIWKEVAGHIYWVDIAFADGQTVTNPDGTSTTYTPGADIWGWHESDQHWNDDAVQTGITAGIPHLGPWNRLTHPDGTTVDMAFEVLTDLPEPTSIALLAVGLAGLGFMGRRKQKVM